MAKLTQRSQNEINQSNPAGISGALEITPHVQAAGMLKHGNSKYYGYSVPDTLNEGDQIVVNTRFGNSKAAIVKEIMRGNGSKLVFIEFVAREKRQQTSQGQRVSQAEVLAAQMAVNAQMLETIQALVAKMNGK